jgi:hypothetical protein
MSEAAVDQLQGLRKRLDRTIRVVGDSPEETWVRYEPAIEMFEIARVSEIGNIEVEAVEINALINLFAENPTDVKPLTKAFYDHEEHGRCHLWKLVDERYDVVQYVNPQSGEAIA